MMTTTEIQNAAAEIISTLNDNVERIEAALAAAKTVREPGFVFVWQAYWLGVRFKGAQSHAVGIDLATVTHKTDNRIFTNGHGKRARLMPLVEALEGALAHSREVQADMTARIAATAKEA